MICPTCPTPIEMIEVNHLTHWCAECGSINAKPNGAKSAVGITDATRLYERLHKAWERIDLLAEMPDAYRYLIDAAQDYLEAPRSDTKYELEFAIAWANEEFDGEHLLHDPSGNVAA